MFQLQFYDNKTRQTIASVACSVIPVEKEGVVLPDGRRATVESVRLDFRGGEDASHLIGVRITKDDGIQPIPPHQAAPYQAPAGGPHDEAPSPSPTPAPGAVFVAPRPLGR